MNGVLLHFLKTDESRTESVAWMDRAPGFRLSTCQREFWLGEETEVPSSVPAHAVYRGEAGYELLLRIATGLESAVLGETEILGQFKTAWNQQEAKLPRAIRAEIHALLEDVKMIRTHYLIGLGGQSYGSLVRKLLGGKLSPSQKVGLIGAGTLAQEILPYLAPAQILWSNRSAARMTEGLAQLSDTLQARVECFEEARESEVWQQADIVLVCVPEHAARDAERKKWRAQGHARVIHMGLVHSQEGSPWEGVECLERVFAIDQAQRLSREIQVEHARMACRDRARLRSLGGGVSVPHGWEDLALFG